MDGNGDFAGRREVPSLINDDQLECPNAVAEIACVYVSKYTVDNRAVSSCKVTEAVVGVGSWGILDLEILKLFMRGRSDNLDAPSYRFVVAWA